MKVTIGEGEQEIEVSFPDGITEEEIDMRVKAFATALDNPRAHEPPPPGAGLQAQDFKPTEARDIVAALNAIGAQIVAAIREDRVLIRNGLSESVKSRASGKVLDL